MTQLDRDKKTSVRARIFEESTSRGLIRTRTNTNPKWHRSQCCGQKWECACVAQTKKVRNDSGGRGALAKFLEKKSKSEEFVGVAHSTEQ